MPKLIKKLNPGPGAAALALISGAGLALAFPPYNLWFIAPLCLMPLWHMVSRLRPGAAFGAGWLWALGQFMAGMYWLVYVMTSYGGMPVALALLLLVALCLYLGLYTAFMCWLLSRLHSLGAPLWLAAPFLWVGLEFLRGHALTGFPWLSLSLSLSSQPVLLQSAQIWGAIGLSFFMVLFSLLLAYALGLLPTRFRLQRVIYAGLALIMALAFWLGGQAKLTAMEQDSAPTALVSVVQGNIPLERLWLSQARAGNVMQQISLTGQAAEKAQTRPWLVLWSESAAPFIFLHDANNSKPILHVAANLRAWLALGTTGLIFDENNKPGYSNRMFLVSPEGQPVDHYDKVHLVPFGEYVPLAKLLFFVRAIAALSVDMIPGQAGKTMQAGDISMGPLICYESIFPELARQHKLNGANLLLNPTNDAWFGPTGATEQHLGQLVLRAVENRLPVARAANTGVSCFILPTGQVIEKTQIFTEDARTAWLPLGQSITIFTRYGEVVGWLGLMGCGLGFFYVVIRGRRSHRAKG